MRCLATTAVKIPQIFKNMRIVMALKQNRAFETWSCIFQGVYCVYSTIKASLG